MTLETRAAFARRQGVERGTVTKWADAGRIVLVDGKVDVETSLARLQQTEGPRPDVVERHNQQKNRKDMPEEGLENVRRVRLVSEARIKRAEAEIREMERDKAAGTLIEKSVVDFVMDDYGSTLRTLLENLADRYAPMIFPLQTLDEVHAALAEAGESILREMTDTLKRRAKEYAVEN